MKSNEKYKLVLRFHTPVIKHLAGDSRLKPTLTTAFSPAESRCLGGVMQHD
jgi:hypothetical protein